MLEGNACFLKECINLGMFPKQRFNRNVSAQGHGFLFLFVYCSTVPRSRLSSFFCLFLAVNWSSKGEASMS